MALISDVGRVVHALLDKGVSEGDVLLRSQAAKVKVVMGVARKSPAGDKLVNFGRDQELEVLALEFFDVSDHERNPEVFEAELSRVLWVLNGLLLRVFGRLLVKLEHGCVVGERLQDGIYDVVELLGLTTEGRHELITPLVASVNLLELLADDWMDNCALVNEDAADFITHFLLCLVFVALLAGSFSLSAPRFLTHSGHGLILRGGLDTIGTCLQCLCVRRLSDQDAFVQELACQGDRGRSVEREGLLLVLEPGKDILV